MDLLLAFLLFQTVQTGAVTGVVRGTDGRPASGVRVYAIALRDAQTPAKDTMVLESLTETDALGRYRLEIPPGRYYIACGAVDVPTYYPNTTARADARQIAIASGDRIDGIDFSGFSVPRQQPFATFNVTFGTQSPPPVLPAVSGAIRLSDGTPARDMDVIIMPAPTGASASTPFGLFHITRADDVGRYRFSNMPPGNYYIVSGTPELVSIYPGTPDIAKAQSVSVAAQDIRDLDFTVSGPIVSGRVVAQAGVPAIGTTVRLRGTTAPIPSVNLGSFFADRTLWETHVDGRDGSFSILGLPEGTYTLEVDPEAGDLQTREVVVRRDSVGGIDFSLPVVMIAGTIVMDDGSAPSDTARLGSVVLSSTRDGDDASTIFRVSNKGTFGGTLDPGEYRLDFPALPWDYNIVSITSGGIDLLKERFTMTASEPRKIEVRMERLSGK